MNGTGSTELGMSSHVSESAKKKTGRILAPVSENEEEKNKSKASQLSSSSAPPSSSAAPPTASSATTASSSSETNKLSSTTSSVDLGVGWETFTTENRKVRNEFLEYVQSHSLGATLTRRSKRGTVMIQNNSYNNKNKHNRSIKDRPKTASFITFSYPPYIHRNIVVPAPADMVTLEVNCCLFSLFVIVFTLTHSISISLFVL